MQERIDLKLNGTSRPDAGRTYISNPAASKDWKFRLWHFGHISRCFWSFYQFTEIVISWGMVTLAATGRWQRLHRARLHVTHLSRALHAGGSDESVPVRILQRQVARLPLLAAHDSAVYLKNLRAAA